MVVQVFSEDDLTGHMRVVIGYYDSARMVITHDPNPQNGPFYHISYARFVLLWEDAKKYVYPNDLPNASFIITPPTYPTTTTSITSSSLMMRSVGSSSTTTASTNAQPSQTNIKQLSTSEALATVGTDSSSIEYLLGALALIAIGVVVAVLKSRSGWQRQG